MIRCIFRFRVYGPITGGGGGGAYKREVTRVI